MINSRTKEEVMKYFCKFDRFPACAAWKKIVRRDLFVKYNILFENNILSEDIDYSLSLYQHANTFFYYDQGWYVYRLGRVGSITYSIDIRHVKSLIFIIKKWAFEDIHRDRFQFFANTFLSNEYVIALYYFSLLEKKDQQKVISELREYKWLLKFANNKRTKITRLCVSLFGIRATSILLNKLKKII